MFVMMVLFCLFIFGILIFFCQFIVSHIISFGDFVPAMVNVSICFFVHLSRKLVAPCVSCIAKSSLYFYLSLFHVAVYPWSFFNLFSCNYFANSLFGYSVILGVAIHDSA